MKQGLYELDTNKKMIELLRRDLHHLISREGYHALHPEVIDMSQRLDRLIVDYTQCVVKKQGTRPTVEEYSGVYWKDYSADLLGIL